MVEIELPWFVTVLDKVLIEFARAERPVDESVIALFKDVILTEVDMLLAELTPATNSMLEAFCDMAVPLEFICVCNVVSDEDVDPAVVAAKVLPV